MARDYRLGENEFMPDPPPVGGSNEDVVKWADTQFQRLRDHLLASASGITLTGLPEVPLTPPAGTGVVVYMLAGVHGVEGLYYYDQSQAQWRRL